MSRTRGCSGCLIEAIERADEAKLRRLLSAPNLEFSDTYWTPPSGLMAFLAPYPQCSKCFPVLSTLLQLAPRYVEQKECEHSVVEGSLVAGQPPLIAMSVVLVSMLYTKSRCNALQMLIDSQKFDLSEPLVFHYRFESDDNSWDLVAISPIGLAILLDKGSSVADPTSFLLLKTLSHNSLLKMELELRYFAVEDSDQQDDSECDDCRASDVFSFLIGCYDSLFSQLMIDWNCDEIVPIPISTLDALSELGALCFNPDIHPAYFGTLYNSDSRNMEYTSIRYTILEALAEMNVSMPAASSS